MGSACGASKPAGSSEADKGAPVPQEPTKDFVQRVVVVRHGNRLDHQDPIGWFHSDVGKTNPYDTPLTKEGRKVARNVGKKCPKAFDLVVCSPYMRCLQTGCEIASEHKIPIAFDYNLGEVFDDVYMPKNKAGKKQIRSGMKLRKYVEQDYPDVKVMGAKTSSVPISGKHPAFPEDFLEARVRFFDRFEYILQECSKRALNPIIVTHADAVVALFETISGRESEKVDYCGWFIAEKADKGPDLPIWTDRWRWEVGGHMVLEEGEPEVCHFGPIISSIAKYKKNRATPYPEISLSAAPTCSDAEKATAMEKFWGPSMTLSVLTKTEEEIPAPHKEESLSLGGALKVIEASCKFKKGLEERRDFTPKAPDGFEPSFDVEDQ
jgi:broad specificity phosphatase PhoE